MIRLLLVLVCVPTLARSDTCSKFSSDESTAILRALNEFRISLANGEQVYGRQEPVQLPEAANMMKLEWDCDLAKSAQKWTDRCVFKLEPNPEKGENIYTNGLSPIADPRFSIKAVDEWKRRFAGAKGWLDLGTLTLNKFNEKIKNAVQISWAASSLVGCGVSSCGAKNQTLVSCRFDGSYVVMDKPIYIADRPCSRCPTGTQCEPNESLCSKVETTTEMTAEATLEMTNGASTKVIAETTTEVPCSGIGSDFSETQKTEMVKAHNKYRSQIALGQFVAGVKMNPPMPNRMPKATNMMQITWDCQLAEEAQSWANRCKFEFNRKTKYGSNLYVYGVNPTREFRFVNQSVERWIDEQGFISRGWLYKNNVTLTQEVTNIRSASQIAWAETSKIGCGVTECPDYPTMVVCYYEIDGSFPGKEMYKMGETCSQCNLGTVCDPTTGLCVKKFLPK